MQPCVTQPPDTAAMDAVWQRLDAELRKRKRNWPWLARQLGHENRTRIYNWRVRGVPVESYPEIAVALGESIDWVAGMAPPRATAGAAPSPMAARLAAEFDQIADSAAQLDAFAKCIGIISLARES